MLRPDTVSREYRLILDETTTTPDLIDQNILYAKIMIKPARAIEFIAIDFIMPILVHHLTTKKTNQLVKLKGENI